MMLTQAREIGQRLEISTVTRRHRVFGQFAMI